MAPSRTCSALSSAGPSKAWTLTPSTNAAAPPDSRTTRASAAESSRITVRINASPSVFTADAASQSAAKASLPTPSRAKVDWKRRSSAGFMILRTTTASFSPSSLLRCARSAVRKSTSESSARRRRRAATG